MKLKIETEIHDQIIEVKLYGEVFTEEEYAPIYETVNEFLEKGFNLFIINLEGMSYINSLGLNSLIKVFTAIRNSGGDMVIVNISKKINQVLILTKLNSVLNIATSHKNAIEHLKK
ncbi:MAG: STAS domain-containing protein [Putridiphycobacter sp.]|jgi:anti-sigma B factor antagonist|nr:STAS domain-containing protein [Putridiphycobacter sp.]